MNHIWFLKPPGDTATKQPLTMNGLKRPQVSFTTRQILNGGLVSFFEKTLCVLTHHTAQFKIRVDLQQLESQKDSQEERKDERCQLQNT